MIPLKDLHKRKRKSSEGGGSERDPGGSSGGGASGSGGGSGGGGEQLGGGLFSRHDGRDVRAKKVAGFEGEVTAVRGRTWKNVKQIVAHENFDLLPPEVPTFSTIEAPPSTIPAKKYCDLTGFSANYTDPKTKIRFCSPEAFRFIRSLPEHRVQDFLAIRQAETRLK